MADQNPNAQSNIDDLVKELSRPQNVPSPSAPSASGPSAVPAQTSAPLPSAVPKPVSPSPSVAPKPAMPAAPAPKPTSSPSAGASGPSATPPAYQSNIRTMADDLASLKTGQQPQGTTVPRTPAAPAPAMSPKPAMPAPAPRPVPPVSMSAPAPKPAMPPQAPVPPTSGPSVVKPVMPQSVPKPAPVQMPKPSLPSAPASTPSQLYTPETSPKTGGNRNLLFIGIGIAVVVLGVLYWALFIRSSEPVAEVPVETFTPRPSATPRIVISSLFPSSAGTIALTPGADPFQTFSAGMKTLVVTPGRLGSLSVTYASSSQSLLPFELFDRLLVAYPIQLRPTTSQNDGVILAFGQQESFNAKGQAVPNTEAGSRLAFVTQVSDSAAAELRNWEATMTDNLANLFGINKSKNTGPFSDASYQGVNIRYKNFPYPDMSIDYALFSFNGSNYLVITNSRETMFAVTNTLNPPGK